MGCHLVDSNFLTRKNGKKNFAVVGTGFQNEVNAECIQLLVCGCTISWQFTVESAWLIHLLHTLMISSNCYAVLRLQFCHNKIVWIEVTHVWATLPPTNLFRCLVSLVKYWFDRTANATDGCLLTNKTKRLRCAVAGNSWKWNKI